MFVCFGDKYVVIGSQNSCCLLGGSNTYFLHLIQIKSKILYNAVFLICLLIFYFSLLKYTYHYNYRPHISLQVAKLAKSARVQILIFPTVYLAHESGPATRTNPYAINND